jgi:hypothetical protein
MATMIAFSHGKDGVRGKPEKFNAPVDAPGGLL